MYYINYTFIIGSVKNDSNSNTRCTTMLMWRGLRLLFYLTIPEKPSAGAINNCQKLHKISRSMRANFIEINIAIFSNFIQLVKFRSSSILKLTNNGKVWVAIFANLVTFTREQ